MQGTARVQRTTLRYSISTLLVLTVCVGGFLGGYRTGYQAGDSAFRYGSTYAKAYNVHDLVAPIVVREPSGVRADFSAVLATVNHAGTGEPDDRFAVQAYPINLCVLVTASGAVHRRVHESLEALRRNAPPLSLVGQALSPQGSHDDT